MTGKASDNKAPQRLPAPNPERERRLAEALRANLRRRRGQARDRENEATEMPADKAESDLAAND